MQKKTLSSNTLQLKPGMYTARLQQVQTMIAIGLAPQATSGTVDFFCSDSVNNNTLQSKHDCIVIRISNNNATLLITGGDAKDLLSLKVDKISELKGAESTYIEPLPSLDNEQVDNTTTFTPQIVRQPAPQASAKVAPQKAEKISLLGHIEWKGDVKKAVGERLGDPQTNKRLEGFAIEWRDKPEGVDIAYSCTVQGMGRSPVLLSGDFAGTKARNAAIVGVSISLIGKNSTKYVLEGSAFFAGVDPQELRPEIECKGPTGQEQLVSLEIKVVKKHGHAANSDSVMALA